MNILHVGLPFFSYRNKHSISSILIDVPSLTSLEGSLDGLGHFLEQFKLLRCACEELLNSKTLRLLLEEALTMGNYINGDAGL